MIHAQLDSDKEFSQSHAMIESLAFTNTMTKEARFDSGTKYYKLYISWIKELYN